MIRQATSSSSPRRLAPFRCRRRRGTWCGSSAARGRGVRARPAEVDDRDPSGRRREQRPATMTVRAFYRLCGQFSGRLPARRGCAGAIAANGALAAIGSRPPTNPHARRRRSVSKSRRGASGDAPIATRIDVETPDVPAAVARRAPEPAASPRIGRVIVLRDSAADGTPRRNGPRLKAGAGPELGAQRVAARCRRAGGRRARCLQAATVAEHGDDRRRPGP